jgi:hypothetical protein
MADRMPLGQELEDLIDRLAATLPQPRHEITAAIWEIVSDYESKGMDPISSRRNAARAAYSALGESPLKAGGDYRGCYAVGCIMLIVGVAALFLLLL